MSTPQEQDAMEAAMSSSLGAMGPLLRKLDLLLAPEYPLRKSLKQAIELLKEDLEKVGTALVEQSMLESPSNKAKYWMDEVRELSYDIEDCIDDIMRPHTCDATKVRSVHCHRVARLKINRLSKLLKPSTRIARVTEVRALVWQASERYERYQLDGCSSNPLFAFTGPHSRVSALCKTSANLVGVDDSRKELTEWITNREEKQLKVLSIVGSAGVGKTALIRSLYNELKGQFECRAIIRLSRKPDMSKLLGEIISQVHGPRHTSDTNALQKSIDSIREHLKDKRYFIVIDDLWDATAWDILNNAFPKGNNCSRIIITVEVEDVVTEFGGYHSVNCFEMKPLGSHDSEKLFLHRGFGSEHHCPDHLKEVSCRIVKECGGLPLAIITMAGLLASELDNRDLWNQLLQCFFPGLAILTLEERLEKIVNLCYNSLPRYLKTCLLYLNIYPEGSTIWKVDLLKQWIAEGFVSATEGKEVVAESYFNELLNRGMIQPEKISHTDEVLSCTVHYSIHDLITHKSSEEKFITAIDYSQAITGFLIKGHRLSLHCSCAMYASKPQGIRLSQIRSLAFFGLHSCMPSIIEFKRLRVLNLELWGDYDDCTTLNLSGLSRLFQLRYLKVSSRIFVELPSRIQGLQLLETLEIDGKVSGIPNDIAFLPSLLHLSLPKGMKLPDGIGSITSLQTLQYFDLGNNSENNVRSLGELINLHNLCLTCTKARSNEHLKRNLAALSSCLERLTSLRSLTLARDIVDMTVFVDHSYVMSSIPILLQRLELSSPICTFSKFPEWIAELQKLHTLKIIVRVLVQKDIDILAGLPVLTSLSLFVRRPTSDILVFHSGAFPVLKYFKYWCGALCLAFKDKALPKLQRLKLGFNVHRGDQIAHMIYGFEYLFDLKEITIEIGAAAGAESERMAAEFVFKEAIQKHAKFHNFTNIRKVVWIEEEKMLHFPISIPKVQSNMGSSPPDDQEKVIAAAQHIIKTVAGPRNAATDMIHILPDSHLSHMPELIAPHFGATTTMDSIMEAEVGCSQGGVEKGQEDEPKTAAAARDEEWDAAMDLEKMKPLSVGSLPPGFYSSSCCRVSAATKLQKVYRSYRTRRKLADSAVIVEELWWQALEFAQLNHSTIFFDKPKPETAGSHSDRSRHNASKVGQDSRDGKALKLAFAHWIEAIDPRHRSGHNLHFYYDVWCQSQAGQPFFYWLDIGEGKDVDLPECPRTRLMKQCIKYLGPQERELYEYIIKDGKIIHKQTGEPLDTSLGPKGAKWIFVMSTSKRIYAGQKEKGVFRHSSFLAGGATIAAGRLIAENGVIKSIWAYSGHYKPSAENFLNFLEENGVDFKEVEVWSSTKEYEDGVPNDKQNLTGAINRPQLILPSNKTNSDEDENAPTKQEKPTYLRTLSGGLHSPKATDVLHKAVLERMKSNSESNSYQLGHRLSMKWSTGAGPRIGCVRDYPLEFRRQALEMVDLSPRAQTPSGDANVDHSPRAQTPSGDANAGLPMPTNFKALAHQLGDLHVLL